MNYELTIKNWLTKIVLPFYLLTLVSCSEEIDINLKTSPPRLVVEGGIGIDEGVHTIILSKTTHYFATVAEIPYISGATVTIAEFDETMQHTQTFLLSENSTKKGHYETAPDAYGKQRHTYRLNILLNETVGGHTTYTADAYFPPIADRIDSIRAVWGQNLLFLIIMGRDPNPNSIRTGWNIEVFADDPEGENYYAMIVYKNGVPLNDTLTRLLLFDNQMISQAEVGLRGIPMVFISDSSGAAAKIGDTLGLEIRCVSKDYYRYIDEFATVYGGSNPMFGGVPANVRGNVSGGAIGYFWAHGNRKAFDVADRFKKPTFQFPGGR